jgi:hypothetical protein
MIPKNKPLTQFDIPEMMDVYANHKNYEIMDLNKNDDRCIIYFSSNGLYHPDNSETFNKVVIQKNRFEWKRNILLSANKVIFLRDVTKQWYLEGINANLNTIEKLAAFLTEKAHNLKVTCVGSSAGGYAAVLFGCLLNASRVLNFSGQYSLLDFLQTEEGRALNPTLVKYENIQAYRKYYSITDYIRKSNTPIFYFFPARSAWDDAQSKLVKNIDNIYEFKFNSETHGSTCFEVNLLDVIAQSNEKTRQLHHYYKDSLISPFSFSVRTSGLTKSLIYKAKLKTKSLLSKLSFNNRRQK